MFRARLLVVPALLLPLFALVAPAHAAPAPTTTTLEVTGGDHVGSSTTLTATVASAAGTPTGAVTFTGHMINVTVPLDASGTAVLQEVTRNEKNTYKATFTGSAGYAASSDTVQYGTLAGIHWAPEPTVARVSPGLKLTLTTATRLLDRFGAPLAGRKVMFSVFAKIPTLYDAPSRSLLVCTAVSDANGLASCKGQGLLGSLVSILAGGAYATYVNGFFPTDEYTKLPVILGG